MAFWKKYRKQDGSVGRQLAMIPEVTSAVLCGQNDSLVYAYEVTLKANLSLRPQEFRKPVMSLVGGAAVLDTDDQSDHAGDAATDIQVSNGLVETAN